MESGGGRAWSEVVSAIGPAAIVVIHGASGLGYRDLLRSIRTTHTGAVVACFPECGRDSATLRRFMASLLSKASQDRPVLIATHSLFVMREVYLSGHATRWVGLHLQDGGGVTAVVGDDIADTGDVIALEEELAQSDRYLTHEARAANGERCGMAEKQKAVVVEVKIDQRALERMVRSAVEDLHDECEDALDQQDAVARATLADLLGFDQDKTTPTWDKVFSAVEDLMAVRRG